MDSQNEKVIERYITRLLRKHSFAKLPRRTRKEKESKELPKIKACKSIEIDLLPEKFSSESAGILSFIPIIEQYGIDKIIERSGYPETSSISKLSSILAFVSLKLSNVRRYSVDDLWCMDRGMGLFARLNVLPKTAWFSSYSHRVTSEMNLNFLKSLHQIWIKEGLLNDSINLDFTTIPYWGENDHLENNWSGKRNKALASMSAVLAQDQDTGIIDYGTTNIKHKEASDTILEFLDFYKINNSSNELKYLIFDSKFTNYENLGKLDRKKIKFLTIRRRGKKIVNYLNDIPKTKRKKIRVECSGNKKRTLYAFEESVILKGYNKVGTEKKYMVKVRQIAISGHGKIKPAIIISNDFNLSLEQIVRKYAKRWLVEKGISEQIHFFHLNNVSSSMVIKVDFDMVMTILSYNLYKLMAKKLSRYENMTAQKIFEKFINNSGEIKIIDDKIEIFLKKKRNLPLLLQVLQQSENKKSRIFDDKKIIFKGASYS